MILNFMSTYFHPGDVYLHKAHSLHVSDEIHCEIVVAQIDKC